MKNCIVCGRPTRPQIRGGKPRIGKFVCTKGHKVQSKSK